MWAKSFLDGKILQFFGKLESGPFLFQGTSCSKPISTLFFIIYLLDYQYSGLNLPERNFICRMEGAGVEGGRDNVMCVTVTGVY